MADASFHFAAGMATGMLLAAPRLYRAWERGTPLAPEVLRWLATSWGLGFWSIIPSLLGYIGLPASLCQGWWMNLFLLHPLINHHGPHATIIGGAALATCYVAQYLVVLASLRRITVQQRKKTG